MRSINSFFNKELIKYIVKVNIYYQKYSKKKIDIISS